MSLLLQLNGDMPDKFPGHERWLYIFGCRRKACRRKDGCIRGLRGTRRFKVKSQEKRSQPTPTPVSPLVTNLGASLFAGSSTQQSSIPVNPFSTNASSLGSANPFANVSSLAAKPPQKVDIVSSPATFAEKVKITDANPAKPAPRPSEPWPEATSLPPAYPSFFLDAEYETLSDSGTPKIDQNVTIEPLEGESSGLGKEDKVLYESSMDKSFQKFADRVAQNPDQAIRYEYNGSPLLYSTTDALGQLLSSNSSQSGAKVTTANANKFKFPTCQTCGASRVFEVQLMPQAIASLEEEEMGIDGMDWGTVILGVCSNDCIPQGTVEGEVGYVDEWVGVQWEELEDRRK